MLKVHQFSGNEATFVISIKNVGQERFDVSTDLISALASTESLQVYSYEEMVERERSKQNLNDSLLVAYSLLQGASAGLAAGGAGPPVSAPTLPVAQMAAMQSIEESDQNLARYDSTILRRHTLLPGHVVGGYFHMQIPDDGPFTVLVRAGSDVHRFEMSVKEND